MAERDLISVDFCDFVEANVEIYELSRQQSHGAVSSYLSAQDDAYQNLFAVACCTIDGQRFELGDSSSLFCLQSASKPINYCVALCDRGEAFVHRYVGREPSGCGFNELSLNYNRVPHNPFINSGAIMCASMIKPTLLLRERINYISEVWSKLSGNGSIGLNEEVYRFEQDNGDRNYALAHMIRESGGYPDTDDIQETLDLYFSCCAFEMDVNTLSVAAATLANGGICPLSGVRVFQGEIVKNCLSLMLSCGMYDFSGEFAFTVGLPAKSGVSGVVMLVVPKVLGMAVWSPRIDRFGNSVRGVDYCKRFVKRFHFHNFDNVIGAQM